MKNFAFCTITYGNEYVELGDSLITQLNERGYHVFVLTNDMQHYTPTELLTPVEYTKSYFSFHEKRTIMQECLKHYDTAIFLDADVFIKDIDSLDIFAEAAPGLHIFASLGTLENSFLNDDLAICANPENRNTKYGKEGLQLLNTFGYRYMRKYHGTDSEPGYLEHFLEGRWLIRKNNGNEKRFFEIWDSLVDFCERIDIELNYTNSVGAGEGGIMSIAAYNSGITVYSNSPLTTFVGNHFISNYVEKLNNITPWNIAG